MYLPLLTAAASIALTACGNGQPTATPAAGTAAPAPAPVAAQTTNMAEPVLALGLTRRQLEDAELLDATGAEIGEVERVVTDASGAVTGLLVEIEDTTPDRYVTIPLDGLTVVTHGDDNDLRSTHTRAALVAMPETPR